MHSAPFYSVRKLGTIRDLNTKTGQEETDRPITGKYSLHTLSNDNGTRLINFACSKNVAVASKKVKQSCYRPGVAHRVPGS